ncbi:unnamed protein product [Gongylonema pulchrum]|uniref:Uncharacterized protein n=1 Tax=Gongylonema pulchrum TaxID=637853 RepID=A0A183D786_9BILA|nr:unnamed protein product [Gongylonema pulchrum]
MAELRQELLTRFQDSSFFLEAREPSCEFRRYTDKYRVIEKEKFFPGGWECLPDELCPKRIKGGEPQLKKRKTMDGGDDDVSKKLSKLEENENNTDQETGMQGEAADDSEEESEKDEINNENEQVNYSLFLSGSEKIPVIFFFRFAHLPVNVLFNFLCVMC